VDELSFRKNVRDAEVVLRRDREHFLECGLSTKRKTWAT
jgi:hypothetical protein